MPVSNLQTPEFDNSYARLPARFYAEQLPEHVSNPALIKINAELAAHLGIDADWLASNEGIDTVAGNHIPTGASPVSAAYAGHQFGNWNPQLGDGRAVLLGEVLASDGERYDVQLKGSGRTPWSRGGDGRSPLGPVLREYIVSEAMAVLGVPTSRSLAAVATGDTVYREQALPGAVLTRVAKSHIRIGTFQYFAARQDEEALKLLVEHVIERHYPGAAQAENPTLAMLEQIISAQAALIAKWQLLGFIHGVMNTDNVLLSGETIDYGPCAFIDQFDASKVFSSIDHGGRYAYRNQPSIAHWNLSRLAQCLLPLLGDDEEQSVALAQAAIDTYPDQFLAAHKHGMNTKLGLRLSMEGDEELVQTLLELMTSENLDFTLTFRRLADLAFPGSSAVSVAELIEFSPKFQGWIRQWQQRAELENISAEQRQTAMYAVNPVYIPRNHLLEAAITAATDNADLEPFHRLHQVLSQPFDYRPEHAEFARPPHPEEVVRQTFCGT